MKKLAIIINKTIQDGSYLEKFLLKKIIKLIKL